MRSKKSGLAMAAVVTALLVFTASGFATAIPYNSSTRIPTARFVSNVFATKTPSSPVFVQSPDFLAVITSQNDPITFGNYATAYDNFTLGVSHNIDGFAWIGGYFNPPKQAVITGFTLTFYADAGNRPGTVLATTPAPGTLVKPSYDLTNSATRCMRIAGLWRFRSRPLRGRSTGSRLFPISVFRRSGAGKRAPALTTSPGNASSVTVERSTPHRLGLYVIRHARAGYPGPDGQRSSGTCRGYPPQTLLVRSQVRSFSRSRLPRRLRVFGGILLSGHDPGAMSLVLVSLPSFFLGSTISVGSQSFHRERFVSLE